MVQLEEANKDIKTMNIDKLFGLLHTFEMNLEDNSRVDKIKKEKILALTFALSVAIEEHKSDFVEKLAHLAENFNKDYKFSNLHASRFSSKRKGKVGKEPKKKETQCHDY